MHVRFVYLTVSVSSRPAIHEEPNPGYETKDLVALAPLVMRRVVEGPKTEGELLDLVNAALAGVQVDAGEIRDTLGVLEGRGMVDVNSDDRWFEL